MFPHFLASHAKHIHLVLVFIQVEHVAYAHVTFFYLAIVSQRSVERDVCSRHLKLQVMNEIGERRTAEITIAHADSCL